MLELCFGIGLRMHCCQLSLDEQTSDIFTVGFIIFGICGQETISLEFFGRCVLTGEKTDAKACPIGIEQNQVAARACLARDLREKTLRLVAKKVPCAIGQDKTAGRRGCR